MTSIKGKWLLFGGVTILAAIAAGSLAVWRQQNTQSRTKAPEPVKQAVVEEPLTEVSLTGKVQAQKTVKVGAPIDGIIESFSVDAGQEVFEGQLLAHIKNPRLDTALESATIELDKAQARVQNTEAAIIAARLEASRARADASRSKSDFERAGKLWERQKLLFKEGATPRLVYEKAETEYNTLKDEIESKEAIARQTEDRVDALNRDLDTFKKMLDERAQAIEQSKADLAVADVHAPVDGIVVARHGQAGEAVTRQTEDLFLIATTLSSMQVIVEPNPVQLTHIKPGQAAAIHVAEVPGESITGTVREISGSQVIVDFTSPTPLIKPGVSAQVIIKLT